MVVNYAEGGFNGRSSSASYRGSNQTKNEKSTSYVGVGNSGNSGVGKNSGNSQGTLRGARARKSAGISAWGIISIIVGLILLATAGYYTFLLYPFLCPKERSYNMMELNDVV